MNINLKYLRWLDRVDVQRKANHFVGGILGKSPLKWLVLVWDVSKLSDEIEEVLDLSVDLGHVLAVLNHVLGVELTEAVEHVSW